MGLVKRQGRIPTALKVAAVEGDQRGEQHKDFDVSGGLGNFLFVEEDLGEENSSRMHFRSSSEDLQESGNSGIAVLSFLEAKCEIIAGVSQIGFQAQGRFVVLNGFGEAIQDLKGAALRCSSCGERGSFSSP